MSDKERDPVLDAYGDWLNEILFAAKKGEGEHLFWLGEHRWAILNAEGPDIMVIELRRGHLGVAP